VVSRCGLNRLQGKGSRTNIEQGKQGRTTANGYQNGYQMIMLDRVNIPRGMARLPIHDTMGNYTSTFVGALR
jgi:hypothetical protein